MQFEKRQVRLGDIRPSEQNPREDFGDIGALARSIEATGGEPLNPPVVVADGNVFRIVDGERRYRALSSIYGEDREVSALVAESMDEANELVAMLATDDKRQLTEAERARGVQQMLVLGVDEQRIERASRATAGQIRAARRLRGSIEGRQVTLDQLEAASAFDDEKDVEAVLAAGDGWAGKADSIRRRNEREEAKAEDYDAFGDAGIPVVKEVPKDFAYVYWANLGTVAEKLKGIDVTGFVAVRKDNYWELYRPDDGSGAEPEKTEEEIRAEQEAEREEAALKDMYGRMVGFVASGAFGMPEELKGLVHERRGEPVVAFDAMGDGGTEAGERVREEFMERLGASRPSEFEAGLRLMSVARDMVRLNSSYSGDDAGEWLDHWKLFRSAGFEPGGDDEWLMARVNASVQEEEKDE